MGISFRSKLNLIRMRTVSRIETGILLLTSSVARSRWTKTDSTYQGISGTRNIEKFPKPVTRRLDLMSDRPSEVRWACKLEHSHIYGVYCKSRMHGGKDPDNGVNKRSYYKRDIVTTYHNIDTYDQYRQTLVSAHDSWIVLTYDLRKRLSCANRWKNV